MFLVLAFDVRNPKRSQARVFPQLFSRGERYFVNQFRICPRGRSAQRDEIQEVGTAKDVEPLTPQGIIGRTGRVIIVGKRVLRVTLRFGAASGAAGAEF